MGMGTERPRLHDGSHRTLSASAGRRPGPEFYRQGSEPRAQWSSGAFPSSGGDSTKPPTVPNAARRRGDPGPLARRNTDKLHRGVPERMAATAPTFVSLQGAGRPLDAYLALSRDRVRRQPAVIVIHEIFGPDAHIQDVTRRFANEGYVAIAPNLFTGEIQSLLTPSAIAAGFDFLRGLPPEVQRDPVQIRAKIAERPMPERAPLAALTKIQDPEVHRQFARDLLAVAEYLRAREDVSPMGVASVGFCFGGAMSGLLAGTDPRLGAAVIFYGNTPPAELIHRIRCPVLGLYGGEDHRITDTIPAFSKEAQLAGVDYTYHVYPGARHAFFNDSRAHVYDPAAAADAWVRVREFLRRTLDGSVARE